jgi:hypothetical protein
MSAECNSRRSQRARAPRLDEAILRGEAILDHAKEVAQWITERVKVLTEETQASPAHRSDDFKSHPLSGVVTRIAPTAAGLPHDRHQLLEATLAVCDRTARLVRELHCVIEDSLRLIHLSRQQLTDPAIPASVGQCICGTASK